MESINTNDVTLPRRSMLKKGKLEIPNNMGVGTMAWGDEKVGFVSDPKYKPKDGEFNPADLQVCALLAHGGHAQCRCKVVLGHEVNAAARHDLQQAVSTRAAHDPLLVHRQPYFPTTSPLTSLSCMHACLCALDLETGCVRHPDGRRDHVFRHLRRVRVQVQRVGLQCGAAFGAICRGKREEQCSLRIKWVQGSDLALHDSDRREVQG